MTLLNRMASGLQAIHRMGIIHCDIAPDNIMLRHDALQEAILVDFGIAQLQTGFESNATILGQGFAGRLSYAAPESFGMAGRHVGAWTDIYSLGVVAYEVATGQRLFQKSALIDQIETRRRLPDLSRVSPPLARILSSMLQPAPGDRFRDADALVEALSGQAEETGWAPPSAASAAFDGGVFHLRAVPESSRGSPSPGLFGRLKALFGTSIGGPHGPGGSEDD
jgi:serine/threonine-protein kinase